MDEHAMTAGVIPVRHAALPGVVKLPRRYEKAAIGDQRTSRYRKVSLCSGPTVIGDGMSDRLGDLMTAIMWVKQELILLRQHDILLKRQFFDIHNSIRSILSRKSLRSTSTSSTSPFTLSPSSPFPTANSTTAVVANCDSSSSRSRSGTPDSNNETYSTPMSSPLLPMRKRSSSNLIMMPNSVSEQYLGVLLVRTSASATALNISHDNDEDNDDTDGDDTFDEDFFRHRTSSMRTSRDLAALARRRGSKELI